MIEYIGQLQSYNYDITSIKSHRKNNKGVYPVKKFCNDIFTFDIEVTSAWLENGKVICYRKGKSNEYWNELQPLSLPYIWQFSCNDDIYYGREFEDFLKVLNDLPKEASIIIWVHNLSYEFQFLTNILEWASVFAKTPHKPMKCTPVQFPNIEFRCSYMLTRLSLDSWGKQLGVKKATGDLDYEKIRTPLTPLTAEELNYCEQDCRVVTAGIRNYIKKYNTQFKIPLTQTGTVRLETKKRLINNPDYVKMVKKLVPKDADEYKILQDVFAGGYTHANRFYSGKAVYDYIEHYDFSSSYPTVMVSEKFPMGRWIYRGHTIPTEDKFEDKAYIMKLKFSQLNCVKCNTYIQSCKCELSQPVFDNGRVIRATSCTITITEQDYITIKNNYTWESVEAEFVYEARKEYLPKEFTDYILELYANKTELKDVEGMEDLYLQSKQYINSMYGMCVTAIVQANVILSGDEWKIQPLTKEIVNKKLDSLKSSNPRERRYFLSYSWGCWVTAYARRNLWKCIETVDYDVLYCDTDSIFVRGKKDFSWYDKEITEKLKKACDIMGLDYNKTRPKTPKGKEKPLGIFTREENCKAFITLGAKRYVECREDDKLYLTVSGINKEAVDLLGNDIENFQDGFNFDKDAESVHKRLCTYITDMHPVTWEDGYTSYYRYGINLRRTGYILNITDEYKTIMELSNFNTGDISESFINKLKGKVV